MGLFSRIRKKSGGLDLSRYAGMRMEVLDPDGRLYFVAYAVVSRDGSMTLKPMTAVHLGGSEKRLPARLRGYDGEHKLPVQLDCTISARGDGSWSAKDLKTAVTGSDRGFFRQETEFPGEVMPMRQNGIERERCRLVNISSHGVCIRTAAEFKLGDRLLLTSRLLREWEITPLMCAVRRGTRRGSVYEYGCEFVDINDETEAIITRAIMEMQVRSRQEE